MMSSNPVPRLHVDEVFEAAPHGIQSGQTEHELGKYSGFERSRRSMELSDILASTSDVRSDRVAELGELFV